MESNGKDPGTAIFTVADIMTPRSQWLSWEWDSPKDAVLTPSGELAFDVVPVVREGVVCGILRDNSFVVHELSLEWCLTHDAPLSQLLSFFIRRNKPACFLLRGEEFIGLVSPADLNKAPARTAIYLQIATLERALAHLIRSVLGENQEVLSLLGDRRQKEIAEREAELQKENVDVSPLELLYLSDMLNIVSREPNLYEKLGFSSRFQFEKTHSGLVELRNQIMHANRPLLRRRDDLVQLQSRLDKLKGLMEKVAQSSLRFHSIL